MERKNKEIITDRYKLINGECLEEMEKIEDHSIDMILCDLPYEVTDCSWDKKINMDKLWKQYKRIIKRKGVIVLFGIEPFSSELRMSNKNWYKYDIIWNKIHPGNPLLSKIQPLRVHENISVFYNTNSVYDEYKDNECLDYLQEELKKSNLTIDQFNKKFNTTMGKHYFSKHQFYLPTEKKYNEMREKTGNFNRNYEELKEKYTEMKEKQGTKRTYNLIGLKPCTTKRERVISNNRILKEQSKLGKVHIQKYTNYPKSIITFEKDFNKYHPTQKPVKLLEYLIRTYSNENETILDNTMGSGSTGVSCMNINRKFIGIELDKEYFEISKRRIEEARENLEKK